MNSAYIPALAALAGSAIGALTSLASAWFTQRHQDRVRRLSAEKTRRQKLYKQFINEASKLYADALVHNQAEVSALVSVYALISRMRVVSSSSVVEKAEAVAHLIIDTYFIPNRSFSDFRELVNGPAADPLRNFSEACRTELRTQMTVERVLNKDAATPEPRNGGIRAAPYDVNARIAIGT